jgi:hypothetical protein
VKEIVSIILGEIADQENLNVVSIKSSYNILKTSDMNYYDLEDEDYATRDYLSHSSSTTSSLYSPQHSSRNVKLPSALSLYKNSPLTSKEGFSRAFFIDSLSRVSTSSSSYSMPIQHPLLPRSTASFSYFSVISKDRQNSLLHQHYPVMDRDITVHKIHKLRKKIIKYVCVYFMEDVIYYLTCV